MKNAYLQPGVAEMLVKSQKFLKSMHPEYSLIVYDAARPRSIQQKMWDAMWKLPSRRKSGFLPIPPMVPSIITGQQLM
jgi:zinc D-Ala-D-Ala dipeptidase